MKQRLNKADTLIVALGEGAYLKKSELWGKDDPVWLCAEGEAPVSLPWREYHKFRNKGFGEVLRSDDYHCISLSPKGQEEYNHILNGD